MTSSRPKQTDAIQLVPKGWGYEKWIVNCDQYCGKILHMVKGKRCSWHMHKIKDEVFYVQSGKIKIYYGWSDMLDMASVATLEKGDKFHVPTEMRHQMIALEDTGLFEFSTEHFDEDSYRLIKGD